MSDAAVGPTGKAPAAALRALSGLLVAYGLVRLGLLAAALAPAAGPLDWPFGRLNGFYLGTTRTVLGYLFVAGLPLCLGLGMLLRRRWTTRLGPLLALAAAFVELYLLAFREAGVGYYRLTLFGPEEAWLQAATGVVLMLATAWLLRRGSDEFHGRLRTSRFFRSAGTLLCLVGVLKLLVPTLVYSDDHMFPWNVVYTYWLTSTLADPTLRAVLTDMAFAVAAAACLIACGGAIATDHGRWRGAAIAAGLVSVWMDFRGPQGFNFYPGALALSYGLLTLVACGILIGARPVRLPPRRLFRADPGAAPDTVRCAVPDDGRWREALLDSLSQTGASRPTLGRWRRYGALALLLTVGLFTFGFSRFGLPDMLEGQPDWIQLIAAVAWNGMVLLVLSPALYLLRRLRLSMRARSAQEELSRPDARRPVLYLRSFEIDEAMAQPSALEFFGVLTGTTTREQKLSRQLGAAGPVIAIGRPGETLPLLGAARFYVSDALWKQKVADVAGVAQLIVWTSGVSEGLQWEIRHLLSNVPPQRLILWAHPHNLSRRRGVREAEWTLFCQSLGPLFPKPLPAALGDTEFFTFGEDGAPQRVEPRLSAFGRLKKLLFGGTVAALRTILAAKGVLRPAR